MRSNSFLKAPVILKCLTLSTHVSWLRAKDSARNTGMLVNSGLHSKRASFVYDPRVEEHGWHKLISDSRRKLNPVVCQDTYISRDLKQKRTTLPKPHKDEKNNILTCTEVSLIVLRRLQNFRAEGLFSLWCHWNLPTVWNKIPVFYGSTRVP